MCTCERHSLAHSAIEAMRNPYRGLSDVLPDIEALYADKPTVLTTSEYTILNQIESIMVQKQILYHISQEERYNDRVAGKPPEKLALYRPHFFDMIIFDQKSLIAIIEKYKLYPGHVVDALNRRHIDLWMDLILHIRRSTFKQWGELWVQDVLVLPAHRR